MREKLIELVGESYVPIMRGDAEVGRYTVLPSEAEAIADHLIANGVTIQKDCHWATETAYNNGYKKGY